MSRITLALAGAALAATTATAAILATTADAGAHPAPARVQTQHFHAKATAQLPTGKASFVLAEQDVVGSTIIGHDVLYCQATRTHSNCQIAFAQNGGLIYAQFLMRDSDHTLHGAITGGSGRYRHAHGTIAGQVLSQTNVRVTLRYQI